MKGKIHLRSMTAIIFLMVILLMVSCTSGGGKKANKYEGQPLRELLSVTPHMDGVMEKYLVYADYQGYLKTNPSVVFPEASDPLAQKLSEEELTEYSLTLAGVSTGYEYMLYPLAEVDKFYQSSGFTPYQVTQSLVAGMPPDDQLWLKGNFETEKIGKALKDKGYHKTEKKEGVILWCEGGGCDRSVTMDMAKADRNFFFGGIMGKKKPVILMNDLVATAETQKVVGAISLGQGPYLLDNPKIVNVIDALDQKGKETITQLLLLNKMPVKEDQLGPDLLAVAQIDRKDSRAVRFAMGFSSLEEAKKAEFEIKEGINRVTLSDGTFLLNRVTDLQGVFEKITIEEGTDKSAVLVLDFVFPSLEEDLKSQPGFRMSKPYVLFYAMMQRYDVNWIYTLLN